MHCGDPAVDKKVEEKITQLYSWVEKHPGKKAQVGAGGASCDWAPLVKGVASVVVPDSFPTVVAGLRHFGIRVGSCGWCVSMILWGRALPPPNLSSEQM